ncbi:MAG TPA: hypothetical protein DCZ55_28420 [Cyanobacteria bacterium UBA11371]|nr:hypothetical protein [Cyanobacteria bacterium UBA11371]HBE33245.1 hypothetical protein [Cyanobacteria bacterium UBA11368]
MGHPKNGTLFLASVVATLCSLSAISKPAEAATLHGGWRYAIDSFNDATARMWVGGPTDVGGNRFEIYGMAIKDDIAANKITVAINSNLSRNGATVPYASGYGHTGWGDLFFHTRSGLFGINFTQSNDSDARTTGVYKNVTAKSVSLANDGWASNSDYINFVRRNGGNPTMGDLSQSASRFGNSTKNVIDSGTKIGDIFAADLRGIDFGHFGARGSQTFGFSFTRSLLPTGDFVATLIQECFNDAIAFVGNLPQRPRPPVRPGLPRPGQPNPNTPSPGIPVTPEIPEATNPNTPRPGIPVTPEIPEATNPNNPITENPETPDIPEETIPDDTTPVTKVPEPTSLLAIGVFGTILLLKSQRKSSEKNLSGNA